MPLLWGLDIDIRLVRTFTLLPAGSFSTKGEAGFFHLHLFGDHERLKMVRGSNIKLRLSVKQENPAKVPTFSLK